MYKNIGEKIEALAATICIITAAASVITGIVLIVNHAVLIGILIAVFGPLLAWLASFFMYGFGQLIEDTAAIRAHTSYLVSQATPDIDPQAKTAAESRKIIQQGGWTCKCGCVNYDYTSTCPSCGAKKWEANQ